MGTAVTATVAVTSETIVASVAETSVQVEATADVSGGSAALQPSKSVTPSESQITVTADTGYAALEQVIVSAITSSYVGSSVTRRSSLSVSGATVTAQAGYYESAASASVSSGTAGTPTATKGTVSNHSVSVTPKVTNTTGYITGSTKTGTAVTVTASELVSGNLNITANTTGLDVTNYATVSVAVPSTHTLQTVSTTFTPTASTQTAALTASSGYDGISTANVTVKPIPSQYIIPTGNLSLTANTTNADCSQYATVTVNVSGGGGGLTLLKTTSLGALSTSSTSGTDTGKTMTLTGYNDYDLLIVDVSVDSPTNNRHTSTVSTVLLTGTSNVNTKNTYTVGSNKWNSRLSSSGTGSTRQSTTAYGIYVNAATVSNSTMTLTFYYKYNNNNTGTINGTYTARVYGVKLYDLIGG